MRTRHIISPLFLAAVAAVLLAAAGDGKKQDLVQGSNAPGKPTVFIIPVSGTVNAAMAAFIGRAIEESAEHKDRIIILELDTYGGEVDAAFRIVDTMLTIKNFRTIAYVKTKAISAGALIALSCKTLYMQHHTTLGDVAPLMVGQDGPKMLGEKFQAPIRAKFRTLAKQNDYPERLTEAMVTNSGSVFEVTLPDTTLFLDSTQLADLGPEKRKLIVASKTVVKSGELLTIDDVEAQRLRFSRGSVGSIDELLKKLELADHPVIRYRESWSELFVKFISSIAPILMTIGVGLLYIEFKNPGFGAPGIIGICCIALVFFSQYMVGLANYTEILIALIGVTLVVVEIFVFPTGGLIAIAGAALLIVSLVLSMQGFVLPKPELPWQQRSLAFNLFKVLGSFVAAGGISFLFVKYLLPKIGAVVQGPYLTETLSDTHADTGIEVPLRAGDRGTVVTALRPAGRVRVGENEYDVVSNGEFIAQDAQVRVLLVQGTRIVVTEDKAIL